jgi:uncharacterized protein (DUF2235 family)
MPKRIVICCDGTGNSFDNILEDSNVAKLYSALTVNDEQRGYYHPGVGTLGAPASHNRVTREWSRIRGLAFGAGLLGNVGDAYRYLMDTYADGDEIFLFGFSRGAFTARALASLIHVFGLLCAGNHELIPYILRMYSRRSKESHHGKKTFAADDAFKWQFSHANEVRIRFCGLWDTVSSYGWVYDPIDLPFLGNNPIIDIGRHAISIHERRCFYQDNLWGAAEKDQDIRQVWFSGVHSDVGGSYTEKTSGLSKITLEWMLVEAMKAGLRIELPKVETVLGRFNAYPGIRGLPNYVLPNKDATLHVSLEGVWWWILEYFPQRDPHKDGKGWYLPRGRMRTIPSGSLIHQSVIEGKYKPRDLPPHEVEPWSILENEGGGMAREAHC